MFLHCLSRVAFETELKRSSSFIASEENLPGFGTGSNFLPGCLPSNNVVFALLAMLSTAILPFLSSLSTFLRTISVVCFFLFFSAFSSFSVNGFPINRLQIVSVNRMYHTISSYVWAKSLAKIYKIKPVEIYCITSHYKVTFCRQFFDGYPMRIQYKSNCHYCNIDCEMI